MNKDLSRYFTFYVFGILAAETTKIGAQHSIKNRFFSYKPCWSSPKNRSNYLFKLASNEEKLEKNFEGPKKAKCSKWPVTLMGGADTLSAHYNKISDHSSL